ncbi:acyltransferase family protein [Burkholderia vietnamiensis]|uniref:acyltransferase family protein n=1 Tax=Burkholderia vietnamiensis TaxID=60552 RepID=UPI001CF37FFF|nr:acyltransferase [Burkholderia vietnamiensis]MCA7985150.1 acyltransferase [Burkholderia vietnamiensis]
MPPWSANFAPRDSGTSCCAKITEFELRGHMRKDFLDGIRGWAALMVVGSHFIANFAAHASPVYDWRVLRFPTDGEMAVYIFFVISGFALSSSYIEKRHSSILTSLALRRYVRLTIPILASSILAFVLVRGGLLFNRQAGVLAQSNNWLGAFYAFDSSFGDMLRFALFNVYFSYDGLHTYNPVLWTMAIELAGSVVVLSALALFGSIGRRPFYIVSIGLCWLLKTPLLAFILGMGIAELYNRFVHSMSGTNLEKVGAGVLICFGIGFSYVGRGYYGNPRLLSVAACAIVIGIIWNSQTRAFFSNGISRALGRISFPIYLTHLLVLCSFSSYIYVRLIGSGASQTTAVNWTLLASIPVVITAAFAFEPVERLSIVLGRQFANILMRDSIAGARKPNYKSAPGAD